MDFLRQAKTLKEISHSIFKGCMDILNKPQPSR